MDLNGGLGWTGGNGWSFVVGRATWEIDVESDGSSLGRGGPPFPTRFPFSDDRGISFGTEMVFDKGGEIFGESIGGEGR